MTNTFTRHLPIPGTYNVRDLGGYATPNGETAWRRVFRADGLHRLDDAGMAMLVEAGVTTVIDLRHDNELESHPNPLSNNAAVSYYNISLFNRLAPTPREDVDVLSDLYIRALDTRQDRIAAVLSVVADAPEGAVLFHCTAGKDRTGIIASLLLGLAGVSPETIIEDYALTAGMIAPMIEEIVADAVKRGADIAAFRRLLTSEPATMAAAMEHLIQTYGSAGSYVEHIGLSASNIQRLKDRLRV